MNTQDNSADFFYLKQAEDIVKIGFYELDPVKKEITRISSGLTKILECKRTDITSYNDLLQFINKTDRAFFEGCISDLVYQPNATTKKIDHVIQIGNKAKKFISHTLKVIKRQASNSDSQYTIMGLMHDTTERHNYERKVSKLAYYDLLTSLPNRAGFERTFNMSMSLAKGVHNIALLFIDLDDFKKINDTLGHDAGDELLCYITQVLHNICQEYKMVYADTEQILTSIVPARFGGDEFVIAIPYSDDSDIVTRFSRQILSTVNEIINLKGHDIKTSLSIGISRFPYDGDNFQILLQKADTAMYKAKGTNKNNFIFYENYMGDYAKNKLKVESELFDALKRDELVLFYQPKLNLETGKISGVEALIRWQHPTRGLLSPGEFIEIAEESDLIFEITNKILDISLVDYQNFFQSKNIQISLNLSGKHLTPSLLAHNIFTTMYDKINPSHFEFEITESMLVENLEQAKNILSIFKDKGFKCAIDDFGTGYSSFNYIKYLPIDTVKLDKIFIDNLPNSKDLAILRSMVYMIDELEMISLTEGVETYQQLDYLIDAKCHQAQGYLISKPADLATFTSPEFISHIKKLYHYVTKRRSRKNLTLQG